METTKITNFENFYKKIISYLSNGHLHIEELRINGELNNDNKIDISDNINDSIKLLKQFPNLKLIQFNNIFNDESQKILIEEVKNIRNITIVYII